MMQTEPLRILLIEHEDASARVISGLLESTRESVSELVIAGDLDAGVARLGPGKFDVVVLEFFLPDGAGISTINLLRAAAPGVPIIVVGAVDDEAIAVEAVHAGAQDYLVKSQLNARYLLRSMHYALERERSEFALLEAEARYRGLFNHLVEGIFRTTPAGRYLMANNALARIYGYNSPEELMNSVTDIGRRLYVQAGRRSEFKRIMEEHDTLTAFESQIYRKDGTMIWISENCHAVRDPGGKLLYYEGTVEDITQRREVEEDLRHSEALYHSLVETLPQNIFRKDIHGCFTFANQQFCKTLGLPLEEIVGKTDYDFFPPEMAAKFQNDDREVLEHGRSLETVEENQPPGKPKAYVQVVKTPLRGGYGQIIGLQGIFWDITAQKVAEQKVREAQENLRVSEALYHSLVDTMPQCIFRKDLEGRYTFANREFCRMVNHPLEEVIGKRISDLLPVEVAQLRQSDDQRVIQTGKPITHVEENRFQNQDDQYLQVLKIPIFDAAGTVVGIQGMFWDITDLKMAETRIRRAHEALAASEEKLRLKNEQMESDLRMAGEVQLAMLPNQLPAFPRGAALTESAFQFTHRYQPSGAVGGDFFNVTALSDQEAAVFICDVAGHGVRSALVTAMIRALLEELRPLAQEPGAFLTKLNKDLGAILKHTGTPVLTTAFYLVADATSGRVRYANAGHPKPLVLRRAQRTLEALASPSQRSQAALGVFAKLNYAVGETHLQPGDLLTLFTDGLYEVQNPAGDLYSQKLLAEAMRSQAQLPTTELFDRLLQAVQKFAGTGQFDDDVCLVGIERPQL
jgi:sigma-B regulation protein RsbU (phosphoserine phosphatase)